MPKGLIPRQEVFDTYWFFAYERLMMLIRRLEGSKVLTTDPILNTYKFCNTYRICDRVTQYLVRNVQYNDSWDNDNLLFRTVLFRLFSWPETWEAIGGDILSIDSYDAKNIEFILDTRMNQGMKVYTSAFILSGMDAYSQGRKFKNHLRLVEKIIHDGLAERIAGAHSMADVYQLLLSYPMIGEFMAYQLAVDINYSRLTNFDESSFVQAGPGAVRGIRKCFTSIGKLTSEEVIMYMVDTQEQHFDRLGIDFPGLYGRRLQAIDCQGLFCETDKYSRVKFPELPSNRSRIKSKYATNGPLEDIFLPPKWTIALPG